MTRDMISVAEARRIALGAQGFADPRPSGVPDARHLRRVLRRVRQLQIDSVNVLVRAHYLPTYSRLGPYPRDLLDRLAHRAPRDLFEYWGHAASLLPVGLHPLLRWRMTRARDEAWGGMRRIADEKPDFVRWVLEEVATRGPVTQADIERTAVGAAPRRKDNWGWNWSEVKRALEWLFWTGEVTAARRNGSFERVYDLTDRVLPAAVVATPTPDDAQAHRELVRAAATALGVATGTDLRDYFRLSVAETRAAIEELVADGGLVPVTVDGWRHPAYLDPAARVPRRIRARALVSPFDSLIWERARTERLFGFVYRIEIYVPAAKRRHGYYVLPFLLGDSLVARVDLKADRKAGVLRVPAAWGEPATRQDPEVAGELAAELRQLASWLGLDEVAPPVAGDLADPLRAALRAV